MKNNDFDQKLSSIEHSKLEKIKPSFNMMVNMLGFSRQILSMPKLDFNTFTRICVTFSWTFFYYFSSFIAFACAFCRAFLWTFSRTSFEPALLSLWLRSDVRSNLELLLPPFSLGQSRTFLNLPQIFIVYTWTSARSFIRTFAWIFHPSDPRIPTRKMSQRDPILGGFASPSSLYMHTSGPIVRGVL